jgi:transposase
MASLTKTKFDALFLFSFIIILFCDRLHYEILDNYKTGYGERFAHYLDHVAQWRDQENIQNPIIIMDNVPFHHTDEVKAILDAHGFEYRYLPPYTPYFNAIENLFAEWKNFVERAEPNNLLEIYAAMNRIRDILTPQKCDNYVRHIGMNCLRYTQGQRHFTN